LKAKTNKGDKKKRNKKESEIKKTKESKIHTLAFNFTYTLQILVILDYVSQIIFQMPFLSYGDSLSKWGFRKIWTTETGNIKEAFNYSDFENGYKGDD
jgi:hypothetical protein